jgi:hypothetical protein
MRPNKNEIHKNRNGNRAQIDQGKNETVQCVPVGGFLDLLGGEEEWVFLPAVERRRHWRSWGLVENGKPRIARENLCPGLEKERGKWGNGEPLSFFSFGFASACRSYFPVVAAWPGRYY